MGGSEQGWGSAILRAIGMLAFAFLVFAIVPNWLLDRIATRVTTTGRDLILLGWWTAALVASCWVFVRLQGREA